MLFDQQERKEQMHKITVSTLAFDEFICFVSAEFVKRSNFHVRIRCGTERLHVSQIRTGQEPLRRRSRERLNKIQGNDVPLKMSQKWLWCS